MKKSYLKFFVEIFSMLFLINTTVFAETIKRNDNLKNKVTIISENNISKDNNLPKYQENKVNLQNKKSRKKKTTEHQNATAQNILTTNSINTIAQTTGSGVSYTDNTSPSKATYIDLDNVYMDTINVEGEERWYYTYLGNPSKLTVCLNVLDNENMDYDLHLFSFDEATSNLTEIKNSQYGAKQNEQLSDVINPGYYFICINSFTGFDTTNQFAFIATATDRYDSSEPDDNFNTRSIKNGSSISINQTLDNPFDVDWIEISVTQKSYISASLTNVSTSNIYNFDIYNGNLQALGTLEQDTNYGFLLESGTYYIRVSTKSGFDATNNYNLKIDMKPYDEYVEASKNINVELYNKTFGNVNNTTNTNNQGLLYGFVKDGNGQPVANRSVAIASNGTVHKYNEHQVIMNGYSIPHTIITETGDRVIDYKGKNFLVKTDSNGYFESYVDADLYDSTTSYYAYVSTGDNISCNIYDLIQDSNNSNWTHKWVLEGINQWSDTVSNQVCICPRSTGL